MNIALYFRFDDCCLEEFEISQKYFNVKTQRTDIASGSLVIPRYSALPFYKELEFDIKNLNCKLINTYQQFQWVANFEYYDILKDFTFKTYFDQENIPDIPMVVKGKTNSRKHQWNSHFFAKNRKEAIQIACELKNDSLIGNQDIIFREYIELETFEYLINQLPVTNEFRFFFYKNTELCHGYYWSNAEKTDAICEPEAIKLANEIANIVCDYNNFFVIDVGKTKDGRWIMIELNSGEMSGLSLCDPNILYSNLKEQSENDKS